MSRPCFVTCHAVGGAEFWLFCPTNMPLYIFLLIENTRGIAEVTSNKKFQCELCGPNNCWVNLQCESPNMFDTLTYVWNGKRVTRLYCVMCFNFTQMTEHMYLCVGFGNGNGNGNEPSMLTMKCLSTANKSSTCSSSPFLRKNGFLELG